VGVKDSERVVFGNIDEHHLKVVEDWVIVDRLDPIIGDVVENFFDVAFRFGVANIIQFWEKGMATASSKLESISGEERHLGGAENGLEVCWTEE
jgi:hypothetical protein